MAALTSASLMGCYLGADTGEGAAGADTEGGTDAGGEDASGGEDDDDGADSGDPAGPDAPDCSTVGPRMVRRLTSAQLFRSLQVIFDDPNVPEGQVLTDPVVNGFRVDATEAVVRDLGAQQIMQYAETVAQWAVTEKLPQIASCQTNDAGCHEQVVRELGEAFHREPLDATMVAAYTELIAGQDSFADAMRELIAALIQSPYFLYRRELGVAGDDGRFQLTDHELATNLAYALTGGPPDAQLRQAAAEGALGSDAELLAHVDRLAQTDAGQHHLAEFMRAWLEVEDLHSRVKAEDPGVMFDEAMREDMLTESDMLFLHVFNTGGDIAELFLADYTFVNQRLGHFYRLWEANTETHEEMAIPSEGEGVRPPGILGHGSVLARHALADNSSPVLRGVLVRRRVLCQELPDPPSDVETNLEPIADGATNRQRYEQHTTDPVCASCHAQIDPIGFTFEHYDQLGRYRDQESNQPVDASGELKGVSTGDTPLDDVRSLAEALAETDEARSCFAEFLSYYTYGLSGCNAEAIEDASGGGDATLRSTLEAIVTAPHFRERVAVE